MSGVLGSDRSNPFVLSGGQYTPAQREQIERKYISDTYAGGMADGTSWKWRWVETRTFPDNGHTYDVVNALVPIRDAATYQSLWFDVTDVLGPKEKGPLVLRANTVPAVKPAGQTITADSSWILPTLAIAGVLTAFTIYELATRPEPLALPPIRPIRRRRR